MAGFRKGRFQVSLQYTPDDLQLLLAHAEAAGQAGSRYDAGLPCHMGVWTHPRSPACRAESCLMFSLQFDPTSITAVTMHADYGWSVFLDELARLETAALGRTVHGRFLGIPTGLPDLDRLTGGLRRGELTVVASQSNVLATDLALHMVRFAALRARAATLYVSLETPRSELTRRLVASLGCAPRTGVCAGSFAEVAVHPSASPVYIDDTPDQCVSEIAESAWELKETNGLALLVIDYFQLLRPNDTSERRSEQVVQMVQHLRDLSRDLRTPVLCLAMLGSSASGLTATIPPGLSHIQSLGPIEQDIHTVLFVHRSSTRKPTSPWDLVDVIVTRQASGPPGTVRLTYSERFGRFDNVALPPDEA